MTGPVALSSDLSMDTYATYVNAGKLLIISFFANIKYTNNFSVALYLTF